jgi:hypothetical protein
VIKLEVEIKDGNFVYKYEIGGGTVDEALFAELDKRNDLAFFKHSSGRMTGLFK